MVTVIRHGDVFTTLDNATGAWTEMTNVVFIEKGRSGVNKTLSESSDALAEVTGVGNVGLDNTRTHTQPVRSDKIDTFPVGSEFPLHINREMWSLPQMASQEDKVPRIVDGKITYFKTSLSKVALEDQDYRTVLLATADMVPNELIEKAARTLRATQVRTVHKAPSSLPVQATSNAGSEDINVTDAI